MQFDENGGRKFELSFYTFRNDIIDHSADWIDGEFILMRSDEDREKLTVLEIEKRIFKVTTKLVINLFLSDFFFMFNIY